MHNNNPFWFFLIACYVAPVLKSSSTKVYIAVLRSVCSLHSIQKKLKLNYCRLVTTVFLVIFLASPVFAKTNPPEIQKYFGDLPPLGAGTLHWFTFKVYDGALWSENKPWSMDSKFALRLQYARNFTTKELVDTSLEEIKRIRNASDKKLQAYEKILTKMFPNVKPGDTIAAVNLPEEGRVELYYNGRLYGQNSSPGFAEDFFSIWLHPETQAASLREQLIGQR